MLKLKELKFSGIGRFVDEQSINMESLGSLVQVDGQNSNTGGSSGSGKSTVFNALDYLLGLNDVPTTVLQSRLTKEPISVTGMFDYDGLPLEITRSKKGLKIDISGNLIEGSSKLSEEKLDEILGMSRDLFRKALHKRQKEGGFFLDFTPKKMYEFMTDCLNLKDLNKKLTLVDKKISDLELKNNSLSSQIISAQTGIKATQDGILAIGLPPVKDIHKEVILELKEKYDRSAVRLADIQARHKQENEEIDRNRPSTAVLQYDGTIREDLEKRRKEVETTISKSLLDEKERQAKIRSSIYEKNLERSQITSSITQYSRAKDEATAIAGQIKKIRDCQCPTCEQQWITESAKLKDVELMKKLSELKEKIISIPAMEEKKKQLDSDITSLELEVQPIINSELSDLNAKLTNIAELILSEKRKSDEFHILQNEENKQKMVGFLSMKKELENRQNIEMNQIRGQTDVDRRAFESAISQLKAYEDARVRYENSLNSMKNKELEYTNSLSKLSDDKITLENELQMAQELKKAVKSYTSRSFDDALSSISDAATKIIRCIPNMSNATIQFESIKENQDGKVKEEINAVISADGEIGIPIKSLSGGERSSVDLAVDLAVIDFIESKTGKGCDLFILDEPFTGLDTQNIEMVLEILKNSNTNKRLIIVDHNDTVKQMVTDRLVVTRNGATSGIAIA